MWEQAALFRRIFLWSHSVGWECGWATSQKIIIKTNIYSKLMWGKLNGITLAHILDCDTQSQMKPIQVGVKDHINSLNPTRGKTVVNIPKNYTPQKNQFYVDLQKEFSHAQIFSFLIFTNLNELFQYAKNSVGDI